MRLHAPPQLLLIALFALLAAACTRAPGEPTALAMVDSVPDPTATALPTTVPLDLPTAVPLPAMDIGIRAETAGEVATSPTSTPAPSPTIPPVPTAAPTSLPTVQPTATSAPLPTATSVPATATPVPATATPEPTATAEPTPEPTIEPAATPEPTATTAPQGSGGPPGSHVVTDYGYVPLGQAGLTSLTMPSALVELIGFHEASHPGAQGINAAATGVRTMTLDSRGRGTPSRSAADIVVPPGEPLRAPITGTVIAAREYVLYCQYTDGLVYIEPDGLPGWQVRLFHVTGSFPAVGDRVIAGETIVATGGATILPFESQVDEFTAEPSWPHVHVEVVDTSVPDDRPPGGGC